MTTSVQTWPATQSELEGVDLATARARCQKQLDAEVAAIVEIATRVGMDASELLVNLERADDYWFGESDAERKIVIHLSKAHYIRATMKHMKDDESWLRFCTLRAIARKLTAAKVDDPYSIERLRAAYAREIREARYCYAGLRWKYYADDERARSFARARLVRKWAREQLSEETKETQ